MSEQDVEIARAFTDAFNAHDLEALIACCHPDVEFHSTFAAVGGTVYNGHDGMREWHRDLEEAWENEISSEPEALFDLGEHLLTFTVLSWKPSSCRSNRREPGGRRAPRPKPHLQAAETGCEPLLGGLDELAA